MTRFSPRRSALPSVLLALLLLNGLGILLTPRFQSLAAVLVRKPKRVAVYVPPPKVKVPPKPKPKPKPPLPKAVKKDLPAPAKVRRTREKPKPAAHAAPGTGAPMLSLAPTLVPARKTPPQPIHMLAANVTPLPVAPLSAPSAVTIADVPTLSTTAGAGGSASGPGSGGATEGTGSGGDSGKGGGGGAAGEPFGLGRGGGGGGPRHVVYILDVSGSMSSRIDKARSELLAAFNGLGPDETFTIAAFSDGVQPFDRKLLVPTTGVRTQARWFLYSLRVDGGTNLDAALSFALGVPGVNEVFVITDGDPTEGETDPDKLEERIRRLNVSHARIDTVGLVGRDPDGNDRTFDGISLLSHISADSGGQFRRVFLGTAE